MTIQECLELVREERFEQDCMFGEQDMNDERWLAVLMEEVGEVSTEILEYEEIKLKEELIQVAAVAVAWVQCIERRRGK